jgi:hypothetical protein
MKRLRGLLPQPLWAVLQRLMQWQRLLLLLLAVLRPRAMVVVLWATHCTALPCKWQHQGPSWQELAPHSRATAGQDWSARHAAISARLLLLLPQAPLALQHPQHPQQSVKTSGAP